MGCIAERLRGQLELLLMWAMICEMLLGIERFGPSVVVGDGALGLIRALLAE